MAERLIESSQMKIFHLLHGLVMEGFLQFHILRE